MLIFVGAGLLLAALLLALRLLVRIIFGPRVAQGYDRLVRGTLGWTAVVCTLTAAYLMATS